jgi:hypothetical protein
VVRLLQARYLVNYGGRRQLRLCCEVSGPRLACCRECPPRGNASSAFAALLVPLWRGRRGEDGRSARMRRRPLLSAERVPVYPCAISLRMPAMLETLSSMSSMAGAW